jgi:hypothetical protein
VAARFHAVRRDALSIESEINPVEVPERCHQHQRAGHEGQGHGELRDREPGAHSACGRDRSSAGATEGACRRVPRGIHRWHEAHRKAASDRYPECHRQHAHIEWDREVRSCGDGGQKERRDELFEPHSQSDAQHRTSGREQHRLRELQEKQTPSTSAECQPHGVFAPTADTANHQKVRHVGAAKGSNAPPIASSTETRR